MTSWEPLRRTSVPRVTRERDGNIDQIVFTVDLNVVSNPDWDRLFRECAHGDLRFRQRTQVHRWGRSPEIRIHGLEPREVEGWTLWVDASIATANQAYEARILPAKDRERLAELAREEALREEIAAAQRIAATLTPPIPISPAARHTAAMAAFDAGLIDFVEIPAHVVRADAIVG